MTETIDKIQEELRAGTLIQSPGICSQYIATLSGELSFYLGQISEIEKNRPESWLKLRQSGDYNSDTATDRAWTRTDEGKQHEWYRGRISRIKSLIGGLKALVRNAENEQINKF